MRFLVSIFSAAAPPPNSFRARNRDNGSAGYFRTAGVRLWGAGTRRHRWIAMETNKAAELTSVGSAPDRSVHSQTRATHGWYWNRLRCMSAAEIGYRVRQELQARLQQLGAMTARRVPAGNVAVSSRAFIALDNTATVAHIAAADRVLAGRLNI